MKLFEAIQLALAQVTGMLTNANMIEGRMLNDTQIKEATTPIFWEMTAPAGAASGKQLYVTYSLVSVNTESDYFIDGSSIGYRAVISVEFFTRTNDIAEVINAFEVCVVEEGWSFQFGAKNYDAPAKLYAYQFLVEGVVSG